MEGNIIIIRGGGGEDDIEGDGMQCSDHPYYRNNNPAGGICAFCLQEKLGKLVSSSFPLPIHPHASSSSPNSSPPSFRSDIAISSSTTRPLSSLSTTATYSTSSSSSLSLSARPTSTKTNGNTRRSRLPFLSAKKKKKNSSGSGASATSNIILKRSKSTTTIDVPTEDFSPRKRNGFWSFLHLSSKSSASKSSAPTIRASSGATSLTTAKPKEKCCSGSLGRKNDIIVEEDNSPKNTNTNTTGSGSGSGSSFERKVSRSRSVGCGSRSFSGDFFEKISTGFGDCALRRVESQREGKHKVASAAAMKERVRCGGLFSGFMMITSSSSSTTSSSSSSSSSSYLVSSSAAADDKPTDVAVALSHGNGRGGRSTWGWAFASPIRAFSTKPSSSKENRRDIIRDANDNNATPNLSAVPSLLAVRG